MNDQRRVRVVVGGLVQGVFFRASVRDTAYSLGVTGWVRNRSDGQVEAEFQGPAEAVQQAVDFCRAGPTHARVDEVAVEDLELTGHEEGFSIR